MKATGCERDIAIQTYERDLAREIMGESDRARARETESKREREISAIDDGLER